MRIGNQLEAVFKLLMTLITTGMGFWRGGADNIC